MSSFIKIALLLTVLPAGLFSADLDSQKKSPFSFYSYVPPLLNFGIK